MPVAKTGPPPARQALLIGLGVICGLAAVVFLLTRFDSLTAGNEDGVDLGAPVFSPGSAEEFAMVVEVQGPFLLPDAAGGDRDIWLQHVGPTDDEGWFAFSVRGPGAERQCFVEWNGDDENFVDSCDGTVYPADGEGLQQYPVSVAPDGKLTVNLNLSE